MFVSDWRGSDELGDGSLEAPFKTVQKAYETDPSKMILVIGPCGELKSLPLVLNCKPKEVA